MKETLSAAIGGSLAAIALCVVVVVVVSRWFNARKRKQNHDQFSRIVKFKSRPSYNSTTLTKTQLQSQSFEAATKEIPASEDASKDLWHLRETRSGIVDPLLGVLHGSEMEQKSKLKRCDSQNEGVLKRDHEDLESENDSPKKRRTSERENELILIREDVLCVKLALVWASNDRSLTAALIDIDQLKTHNSKLFIVLRLEGVRKHVAEAFKLEQKKEYTKTAASLTFSFQEGLSLDDVHSSCLSMVLLEKKNKFCKESILAKGVMPLNQIILVPNKPLDFNIHLSPFADRRRSDIAEDIFGSVLLGVKCVFVGQITAKFDVEIKSAEKLPYSAAGGSVKVEAFVCRNDDRVHFHRSPIKSSNAPNWNSSFTFEILQNNISEYTLEMVVVRVGRLSGISRIARTLPCSEAADGVDATFWREAIEGDGQEILLKRCLRDTKEKEPLLPHDARGLLSVTLERKNLCPVNIIEFEGIVGTLAYYQHEKSWGHCCVNVELMKRGETSAAKIFRSALVPCANLEWNYPFTFSLPSCELSSHSIALALIRRGKLHKGSVIASAIIAPDRLEECSHAPLSPQIKWHTLTNV